MKETRTINLNGIVFNIDNDAYLALSNYLHDVELRLPQEERKDVMTDVEARIAELFQSALFARNVQVVDADMVSRVEERIGKPSDFGENKRPVVKHHHPEDNQGCARSIGIALKVLLILFALPALGIACVIVFSLLLACVGVSAGLATLPAMVGVELFGGNGWLLALFVICATLVIILPIVMIIKTTVMFIRIHRGPKAKFWWTTVSTWIIAFVITIVLLATGIRVDGETVNVQQFMQMVDDDFDDDEPRTTAVLQLPAFQSINVSCPAKIKVVQAKEQSVVLTATNTDNIIAEVKNGVLEIAYKPQKNRYTRAEFTITMPVLNAVEASGATKIETQGVFVQDEMQITLAGASKADLKLQTKSLTVKAVGASEIELEGSTEHLDADLTGASQLEADDMLAQTAHIVCAGASQAELHAVKTLWAQAAGASQIKYKGNPNVEQSLSVGASQIRRK